MRGEYCAAIGPAGMTCILGDGHPVDRHLNPGGASWSGGPAERVIPVTLKVGHLKPVQIGTVTVTDRQPTTAAVADLLEAAAVEMRAVLARCAEGSTP